MTKFRKSIIIFGCVILCAVGALVAFLTLSASGMIESDPIELTLTVSDNEKEYDGTPLTAENYTLTSGKLLQGHRIDVTYVGEQTEVGSGDSSLNAKILDEKERDVSKKYIIRVEGGKLDVTMRSLVVTQKEVTREYTGEQATGGDYTVEADTSLCAGHRLVRSADESGITDVGTGIDAAIPLVYDALGNDVTKNYEIDYTPGKITVEPRKLEIAPVGATKVYDGTPLYADYRVTYGTLLQGHRLDVVFKRAENESDDGASFGLLKAGAAKVAVSRVSVYDALGNDVSRNYTITPSVAEAELRVTKRSLSVTGTDGSWVYDGTEHDTKDSTELNEDQWAGLCTSDTLSVEYTENIRDVGTKPNTFKVIVRNGDDDVTGSYYITYTYKDLVVTPRKVTLTIQRPDGKTYDELPLSFTGVVQDIAFETQDGENIDDRIEDLGDEVRKLLRVDVLRGEEEVTEYTDAGRYTYTVTFDADANFTLTNRENELRGNVTIAPRQVAIELKEYAALHSLYTYSGETYTVPVGDVVKSVNGILLEELATAGETEDAYWACKAVAYLGVTTELPVSDAGEYSFEVEIAGTDNFVIAYGRTDGMLTVRQKEIAIATKAQIEKQYNYGTEIAIGVDDVLDLAHVPVSSEDREKLSLDRQNSIINAGTYAYVVRPLDAKNYGIVGTDRGELVVKPAEIPILLREERDLTHTYGDTDVTEYTLADVLQGYDAFDRETKDRLTLEIAAEIVNAGEYPFTVGTSDSNYTVEGKASGKIVIERQPVEITLGDCEKTFDPKGGIVVSVQDVVHEYDALTSEQKNVLRLTTEQKIADTGWYAYTVTVSDDNYILRHAIDGTESDVTQLRGYMHVTPMTVTLTMKDTSAIAYNGAVKTVGIAEVVNDVRSAVYVLDTTTKSQVKNLLQLTLQGVPKNAGRYPFTVRLFDPKNNYTLSPVSGTYTITPITITDIAYAAKEIQVYNGQPLVCDPNKLKVTVPAGITETLTVTSVVADFGDANAEDKNLKVTQLTLRNGAGEDVTQNYSFAAKTLSRVGEIKPCPLKIVSDTMTVRERDVENYTAEALQELAMQLTHISPETPLVKGDVITAKWSVEVNAEYYNNDNKILILIVTDGLRINDGSGTGNYEITKEDGNIFVSV